MGIFPRVTGIQANNARDTIYVAVAADISALFASIVSHVFVDETGTVQVRSLGK